MNTREKILDLAKHHRAKAKEALGCVKETREVDAKNPLIDKWVEEISWRNVFASQLEAIYEDQQEENILSQISATRLSSFVNQWGQTHEGICEELGYDPDTAEDLLIVDYFWQNTLNIWLPKQNSGYTSNEQAIADALRHEQIKIKK